ncbi:MAG: hypothetical protein KC414_14600, partial [Romboutsia sp.]|nr:hypothetical protein [Romboutsia sp.]
ASNSSIEFEFVGELKGFSKPINCIRFYSNNIQHEFEENRNIQNEHSEENDAEGININEDKNELNEFNLRFPLAACSDSGRVILYYKDQMQIIRKDDGDDAYELCWNDNKLIIGFSSGNIEIYEIDIQKILNHEIQTELFHDNIIQNESKSHENMSKE